MMIVEQDVRHSRSLPSLRSSLIRFQVLAVGFLLGCLLLAATNAGASLPSGKALKTKDPNHRRQFETAIRLYSDRQFRVAEEVLRNLLEERTLLPKGREIVSFMVGKTLYGQVEFTGCQEYFKTFNQEYPESRYRTAALVHIGHCLFYLEELQRAAFVYAQALVDGPDAHRRISATNLQPLIARGLTLSELDDLMERLGDGQMESLARLWIADRWLDAGEQGRAQSAYIEIADRHRRSEVGEEASRRLRDIEDLNARILRVGIMAPLTGQFAHYGRQVRQAAILANETLNGHVRLKIYDSAGDSTRAGHLADSVAHAGCDVVIGPLVPGLIRASAPPIDEHGIVQILPLARRGDFTKLAPGLFQMSVVPARQGAYLARYATESEGMELLATLAPDTPDGREAVQGFTEVALASGATLRPAQFYTPGDTDFGPQLRYIKELSADDPWPLDEEDEPVELEDIIPNLDGMLLWGDPEDLELLVPQVVFNDFRVTYFGSAAWGERKSLSRIRSALDSARFVSDEVIDRTSQGWESFENTYRERWRVNPTPLAGRVYDLITWLSERRPVRGGVQEILLDPNGHVGVTGNWRFGPNRQPADVHMYRYRDGVPTLMDEEW